MTTRFPIKPAMITSAAALAALVAAGQASAAPLYNETYGDGTQSLADVGWDTSATGTYGSAGTFNGDGATTLANDTDGNDGIVFHYFVDNAAMPMAITTDTETANTHFTSIDPSAYAAVTIDWNQAEQNFNGEENTLDVRLAVKAGDQWYASATAFNTENDNTIWQSESLPYTTDSASWVQLTLNDGSATLGSTPANDLSGNLNGVGFVSSLVGGGQETAWYDNISVNTVAVPEPASVALLGLGGLALLGRRRRRA